MVLYVLEGMKNFRVLFSIFFLYPENTALSRFGN